MGGQHRDTLLACTLADTSPQEPKATLHQATMMAMAMVGSRLLLHLYATRYAITWILRRSNVMISLNDTGKVTILTPGAAGEDLRLASAQIRSACISNCQEFVEILAGRLWTSAHETGASGA